MAVRFFCEDVAFDIPNPQKTKNWVRKAIDLENCSPGEINFIFCSDKYLLSINKQYLNHNTYTDIVTFDTSEEKDVISGDIYISVDRIKENAGRYDATFQHELLRVLIHGVLHLVGYGDKSQRQKSEMRRKEETYLSLWT